MMHIEACLRIRDKTITSFSGQGGIKGMASNRCRKNESRIILDTDPEQAG